MLSKTMSMVYGLFLTIILRSLVLKASITLSVSAPRSNMYWLDNVPVRNGTFAYGLYPFWSLQYALHFKEKPYGTGESKLASYIQKIPAILTLISSRALPIMVCHFENVTNFVCRGQMLPCVDKSVNCHLLQHLWPVKIILNSSIDLFNRPRGLEWDDKFRKSRFVFGGNIGGHNAPREESLGVLEKVDESKLALVNVV